MEALPASQQRKPGKKGFSPLALSNPHLKQFGLSGWCTIVRARSCVEARERSRDNGEQSEGAAKKQRQLSFTNTEHI